MSDEEENDLLLQVIEAFSVLEDNTDGIAADVSLPPALYAEWQSFITSSSSVSTQVSMHESFHQKDIEQDVEVFRRSLIDATIPMDRRLSPWLVTTTSFADCQTKSSETSTEGVSTMNITKQTIFQLNEETRSLEGHSATELLSQLQNHGYAFVRMPNISVEKVSQALKASDAFFNLPIAIKERCKDHSLYHKYLGYVNNTLYNKELFQLRRFNTSDRNEDVDASDSNVEIDLVWASLEKQLWPGEFMPNFQAAMDACYGELYDISVALTRTILIEMGIENEDSYLDSLFEPKWNGKHSFSNGSLSKSNMTAFRYNVPEGQVQESVHCPHHSDIGLLTIIPKCMGESGLHVYDWKEDIWLDVERGGAENLAIIFTGEAFSRLTANYVLPCMHEVANVGPGPRVSLPFQLCPAQESQLNPRKIRSVVEQHKRFVKESRTRKLKTGSDANTLNCNDKIYDDDRIDESNGKCDDIDVEDDANILSSCTAGFYMEQVSRSRVSSNFPRLL